MAKSICNVSWSILSSDANHYRTNLSGLGRTAYVDEIFNKMAQSTPQYVIVTPVRVCECLSSL